MKKTPFVRNPYNYDVDQASDEAGLKCLDKTRTIQSQADETDINTIVQRFGLTGELPAPRTLPEYGDFTGITSYHEALNAVAQAREAFEDLPAKIRARFENDPEQLLSFISDDKNYDEAQRLGLVPPKPATIAEDTRTAIERHRGEPNPDAPPERATAPSKGQGSEKITSKGDTKGVT